MGLLLRDHIRVEDLGSALSAPSGLPCNNNNINNSELALKPSSFCISHLKFFWNLFWSQSFKIFFFFGTGPMTDENLGGDKHGGMVDVLLSALQTDGNPHIRFYQTQTVPTFPMFVCENCKCDICDGVVGLGYFAPVETSIFRHILGGNGGCHHDDAGGGAHHHHLQQQQQLVVDVGANVGYFSAYATALGCRVASFEPNRNPRHYLEASAALQDPQHHTWKIYPLAIGKEVQKEHMTSSPRSMQSFMPEFPKSSCKYLSLMPARLMKKLLLQLMMMWGAFVMWLVEDCLLKSCLLVVSGVFTGEKSEFHRRRVMGCKPHYKTQAHGGCWPRSGSGSTWHYSEGRCSSSQGWHWGLWGHGNWRISQCTEESQCAECGCGGEELQWAWCARFSVWLERQWSLHACLQLLGRVL